jgi:hypothetical protein
VRLVYWCVRGVHKGTVRTIRTSCVNWHPSDGQKKKIFSSRIGPTLHDWQSTRTRCKSSQQGKLHLCIMIHGSQQLRARRNAQKRKTSVMVRTIPETRIFPTGGDPFSAQQGKTETPPYPRAWGPMGATPTHTSSSFACHRLN